MKWITQITRMKGERQKRIADETDYADYADERRVCGQARGLGMGFEFTGTRSDRWPVFNALTHTAGWRWAGLAHGRVDGRRGTHMAGRMGSGDRTRPGGEVVGNAHGRVAMGRERTRQG